MFRITDNKFEKNLVITKPIDESAFSLENIQYFDSDGFELSSLEVEYYKANGIELVDCLNHINNQRDWIKWAGKDFFVDHSTILQRFGFGGEAREQIEKFKSQFPQLNKYLRLKPKWGLDFCLEYYGDDDAIEVLHVERDFRSFEEAENAKVFFENKILDTDWSLFVKELNQSKQFWFDLGGFQSNDWKAALWGVGKAEITLKAFV